MSDAVQPTRPNRALLYPAGLGAGVFVFYAVLILLGLETTRASYDATVYHLAVVRDFAATWPAADVSDYLSATTPGYHWVLAGAAQFGWSPTALRMIGAAVASAMVGLLGWWLARESGRWWACAAALPLGASVYVIQPSTSVLPDNAGWLWVLVVALLCLSGPRGLRWLGVGGAMLALVLTRQSHLWAVGVILATGWLAPTWRLVPSAGEYRARAAGVSSAIAAVVPALLVLGVFVWVWGGLAPPTFTGADAEGVHPDVSGSLSPIAPAYILLLCAMYAPFWMAWWWTGLSSSWRRAVLFAAAGGAIGAGLAFVGESTFSEEAGRYGGYWRLLGEGPVIGGRVSVMLLAGSTLGGMLVGACGSALPASRRWVLLLALAGFASAQIINANAWQRYYEPMVLMLLALASASCLRQTDNERPMPLFVRAWAAAGPVVLAGILVMIALTALYPMGR